MKLIKYGLPLIAALALGFGVATTIELSPKAEVTQPVYQPSEPNSTGPRLYGVGIIEPRDGTISVSSPLSGTVSQVNVVAGQRVSKGDSLFSLDNREIADEVKIRRSALDAKKAELDQMMAGSHPDEIRAAEKRLEAMKVSVERAKDAFDRAKGLVEQHVIAEEDFQKRRFALETAQAEYGQASSELDRLKAGPRKVDLVILEREIDLAQAQLERIQIDLELCIVRAPTDAIVLRVNVRKGEYLSTVFASEPSIILAEDAPLNVKVQIDEEEAARIRPDLPAEAVLRGRTGDRLPLRFVRIEPYITPKKAFSGQVFERLDTRVLTVIYEVAQKDAVVYVGQQVDVFILFW